MVLITNDVDEGILLADRIIPLRPGRGATLGPPSPSTSPRPRDRKALQPRPAFEAIRNQVIEYLLGPGSKAGAPRRRAAPTAGHAGRRGHAEVDAA